jgi:hypothetical protein
MRVAVLGGAAVLSLMLAVTAVRADDREEDEPALSGFPLREVDESHPLYAVFQAFRLGVDQDADAAFKEYVTLCASDRTRTGEAIEALRKKEFENIRRQSTAYLTTDEFGFKVIVTSMTPPLVKVTKETKKIYVTVGNIMEPDQKEGVFILEKSKKGEWKLRSVVL